MDEMIRWIINHYKENPSADDLIDQAELIAKTVK